MATKVTDLAHAQAQVPGSGLRNGRRDVATDVIGRKKQQGGNHHFIHPLGDQPRQAFLDTRSGEFEKRRPDRSVRHSLSDRLDEPQEIPHPQLVSGPMSNNK